MSQQTETESSSISSSVLDQWAQEDAHADNVKGAQFEFPSFEGRVQYIIRHYRAVIWDLIKGFQSQANDLQDQFTDIAGRLVGNPKTYVQETENHGHGAMSEAGKQLARKITNLQSELIVWEARFKSELHNGIENPKKANASWHWGIILFLLAGEVILNATFFAGLSEKGRLGGAGEALIVSVGNVGIPLLVGYFAHKLYFSKSTKLRVTGLFLVIVLAISAVAFNIGVAEYRDEFLKVPDSGWLKYAVLFAIGCSIAVISFWKMFSYLDAFIRPRDCYKNQQDAIKEYQDIALKPIKDAQETIGGLLREITIQVDRTQKFIQRERQHFDSMRSEKIEECEKKIGYYHMKYCPAKIDPDPEKPEPGEEQYDFSSAHESMLRAIRELEKDCRKAKDEWQPMLEEIRHSLASTQQRFQASVVAHINAAVESAG